MSGAASLACAHAGNVSCKLADCLTVKRRCKIFGISKSIAKDEPILMKRNIVFVAMDWLCCRNMATRIVVVGIMN